ncbi:TetR/AcrR family transcriptional regulator C-terminal domain-containing protein [Streptomyces mobaraensis NBRC 13819 = DSM 40847]|uniref:Transcriptional regulator n=1 Tax=Streptomyces mobaraensis (strain ATCC 29032 / DSM 40847 / JCM 4168 / NBRC 13819 / NCIMB 11159 / IPCR 16-22) TaxID=1223523 RepID=M2ZY14_STRM1|nr:TetR/AcrR family transcriptional regulator [Streptomyces mobaraensis]EME97658.1 transcriptional regulator [Streptomyces mobaraensis NBRC 13819 = DSM 40847]QTT77462.1 TetR/AcrR family transcriptional regulator C-terminal domain-containing protein [Streptomyces mobaraensis NBRC 13819 = DSM 40847]
MTPPSSPTRGRPARLDRARTVHTALALLDESGLDALTMRRLADALGVQAGALYRHFATKQDLLTAMAEHMLGQAADAADTTQADDWSRHVAHLARALRTALLAHRDGARLFAGTHATGPNTLRFADNLTGALRQAGFDDEQAARALYAITHFTTGHTLEEQATLHPGTGQPPEAGLLREAVTAGTYPHLAATLPTLTSTDYTTHFEYGLHLLLSGLHTTRQSTH